MISDTGSNISDAELQNIVVEELARRKAIGVPAAVAGAGLAGQELKNAVWGDLNRTLRSEFEDIRNDPALRSSNMDQMNRTYGQYLDQGNNPVEIFVDRPGENMWAAGLHEGDDFVIYDSTAPHPAVMAHELGHVQMNHSNDPLSFLQTSGLGRAGAQLAAPLGAGGAALGYRLGGVRGAIAGGLAGTLGASGNFAYELGGASGRALGYLPEDVDKMDAAGDLLRAGLTYGMGGPGTAALSAVAGGGAMALASNPDVKRKAGEVLNRLFARR